MEENPESIRQQFIEAAGHLTQSIGIGRALGQVFAHIYFSARPQTLDDLTAALGISKGGASMTVRQLEQWGALRRVWIKGERKDHYETTESFGRILRKAILDMLGQRVESPDSLLGEAERILDRQKTDRKTWNDDWEFLDKRVRRLRLFRNRVQHLWSNSILAFLLK
jgi:DNA-binding transcriptional regulator GbsR (MarR family)